MGGAHQTICEALHTLLTGANLEPCFWRGLQANLTNLRTFGCYALVRPPGERYSRLKNSTSCGIFHS